MADKPITSESFDKPLGVADPNAAPKAPAGTRSPPLPKPGPDHPQAPDPTGKVLDDPADANQGDVDSALAVDPYRAPAPFSKRDGLPDITSESVTLRMLADYWPADTARFGNAMRARAGEIKAFPSDEALELIRTGIAERFEDEDLVARRAAIDETRTDPPQ